MTVLWYTATEGTILTQCLLASGQWRCSGLPVCCLLSHDQARSTTVQETLHFSASCRCIHHMYMHFQFYYIQYNKCVWNSGGKKLPVSQVYLEENGKLLVSVKNNSTQVHLCATSIYGTSVDLLLSSCMYTCPAYIKLLSCIHALPI